MTVGNIKIMDIVPICSVLIDERLTQFQYYTSLNLYLELGIRSNFMKTQ